MRNLKLRIKENYIYLLSFILTIALMMTIYIVLKIFPFGNREIVTSDMYLQYVSFFGKLMDILSGDASLTYSFSKSIGGNSVGLFAYYMASPFNLILALFPKKFIGEVILIITLLKLGFSGLTCSLYLSKTYKKHDLSVVIFSLCYAFMAYNINFQLNIMWLDGVLLLPLIMLGIDKLINENKYGLYIITLFFAIFSNYYIGYMICIFSVLYFIYKTILNNKLNVRKIGLFISSSLIAGMLSAVLIVPTLLSLRSGKAEFKLFEALPEIILKPYEFIAKLFIGNYSLRQIIGGNPNIYCGVIITILVLLYFMDKNIKMKEKICSLVFLIILIASFSVNTLNILWHGFDEPVGFENRFSFLFSFLAIVLAYKEYVNRKFISNIKILIILSLGLVCTAWIATINYEGLTTKKIILSFIFLTIYCILLKLNTNSRINKKVVVSLISLIVIGELMINAYSCLTLQSYAPRKYIYNYIEDLQPIVNELKSTMNNFYRIEEVFVNTYDDSMLLNYYGIQHSSSSNDVNTKEFMTNMGFKTAPSYEGYNRGGMIPVDSILAIKYQIASTDPDSFSSYGYNENPYYEKVMENEKYIVYENPFALPIAFMVNDKVKDVDMTEENKFNLSNTILNSMVEENYQIYNRLEIVNIELDNVTETKLEDETNYEKVDKEKEASIVYTVKSNDSNPVYMFLKSQLYEDKVTNYNQVIVKVEGQNEFPQFDSSAYNIEYIGNYQAGEEIKIKVEIKRDSCNVKDALFYSCNMDNFTKIYNNLSKNIIQNTEYRDGYIKGNITVNEEKTLLYTSIPYDEGWKIKVDGQDVEYIKLLDGLIAVQLNEGNHVIEFKYKTPGLTAGISISIVTFIIVIIREVFKKYRFTKNNSLKIS